jgi:uncharacterized protein (TIGR02449 family)
MQTDIQQLAEKINALVAVVNQLREENSNLRQQHAELTASRRALEERLALAAQGVEDLLSKLPAS